MQASEKFITLQEGNEAKAVVAPELGGWLLRFVRQIPGIGDFDALYFAQEVVDRYPNQMYAGNPLLFPQVSFSHTAGKEHHYRWQDQFYELPQHGFARRSKWKVTSVAETSVMMELSDSPDTWKAYPFSFKMTVRYELKGGVLHFWQSVENTGTKVLPFSTGIHPYFPVPVKPNDSRDNCYIEIPKGRAITTPDNWESWQAEDSPAQNLPVSRDVSGTLFFTDLANPVVSLVDPGAKIRITLDLKNAPAHKFLAIWSKSTSEPFYCLEPWTALPNSFGRQNAELTLLKPGETFRAHISLSVEAL